jgi:hypothetical protein
MERSNERRKSFSETAHDGELRGRTAITPAISEVHHARVREKMHPARTRRDLGCNPLVRQSQVILVFHAFLSVFCSLFDKFRFSSFFFSAFRFCGPVFCNFFKWEHFSKFEQLLGLNNFSVETFFKFEQFWNLNNF